jgi:hypothetical protein
MYCILVYPEDFPTHPCYVSTFPLTHLLPSLYPQLSLLNSYQSGRRDTRGSFYGAGEVHFHARKGVPAWLIFFRLCSPSLSHMMVNCQRGLKILLSIDPHTRQDKFQNGPVLDTDYIIFTSALHLFCTAMILADVVCPFLSASFAIPNLYRFLFLPIFYFIFPFLRRASRKVPSLRLGNGNDNRI